MIAERIATCGGLGYLTSMPGTLASTVAVAAAWVARTTLLSSRGLLFVTAPLLFLGLWASHVLQQAREEHDPSYIVIDEWVAVWGLCAGLPLTPAHFICALLLFRVFDILKPGPVSWAESLPGVWGVMADDLVAALLAGGCLWIATGIVL